MKNSIVKFTLTTLAVLTLVACGSGGGDSSPSSSSVNNTQKQQAKSVKPTVPSQPTTPEKKTTKENQSTDEKSTGGALVISGQDDKVQVKNVVLTDSNIKELSIDGRRIKLAYPGIYADGWQIVNGTNVCCGKYENVRIGAVMSQGPGESDIIFYNGIPTKNMPQSGSVSYKGDSIISGADINDEDYVSGKSNFTVNFDSKKLSGSITANSMSAINVNADISGNSFKGTAKSSQFTSEGKVEGKFYGDNAAELGGLAKGNDNSWGAAFAGKKQ